MALSSKLPIYCLKHSPQPNFLTHPCVRFEYNNEMVMTFRQAIGRLIRSPEDSGKIFLLDGKFNALSEGLKNRLVYFLEKIAVKGTQL